MAKPHSIRAVALSTALIAIAMSFPIMSAAQECTPADIALVSQASVDDFQSNHGPCERVTGELRIEGNDISSLSGLSELKQVQHLYISRNPMLNSLQGFTALDEVSSLYIGNNASLVNMRGLDAVDRLGDLTIRGNASLRNMEGLSSLERVGGNLFEISNNSALENLDGLESLHTVVGEFIIEDNPALGNCQGIVRLVDPIDDYEPGPGPGVSNIPDIFDMASIQRNLGNCNSRNGILGAAPLQNINAGLNDAWFNLDTDGQGFLIIVFPDSRKVFVAWFTYDTERPPEDVTALLGEPGHRWLTAQGEYEENLALLEVYVTSGGVFDAPTPETSTAPDGVMTLEFSTCNAGTVIYDIASINRQGEIAIERISLDNVPLCYLLNAGWGP